MRPAALAALLFLAAACLAAGAPKAAAPAAARGEIDLSSLGQGGTARLAGEWGFHWRKFVDPAAPGEPDVFGSLPGHWIDYGMPGLEERGFGSYRLVLRGLDPRLDLGLSVSAFLSSARIYADGKEVWAQGRPGDSAKAEIPEWRNALLRIGPQADGELELVVHVSNFADRSGGNIMPIAAGDFLSLAAARERTRLAEIFVVGAILAMSLYYLFLHAFRPQDRSSLFFGLLCFVIAVRILCYDEFYLLEILPSLSWAWLFRAGYLTFALATLLVAAFIRALFPRLVSRWAFLAVLAVTLSYSAVILVLPPLVPSRLLSAYQACAVLVGLYLVTVLARAVAKRERGSVLLSCGFVLFFAAVVFDILVSSGAIVGGFFVTQFGLLAFLFSISLVITKKFAGAFATAEMLTEDLARANRAMKRFVPEEFLSRLGKTSVEQVLLGDHAAQDMTVLFADIGSFTRMSDSMSPEETFQFINEYLARMGPVIRSHGGFVDKYLGDGIMALFPDSPEKAVRCAVDMHRSLARYNSERAAQGREAITIGIGVHSGRLMLGTIGENERMDGTVISGVVNLASRIEGIAKEYSIGLAVSERILLGLDDPNAYHLRFLGKVPVKGTREPVSVFEVYDGDPEPLREAKDKARAPFEKALASFYGQEYKDAMAGFKSTLELLPDDEASRHYIRIIRKLDLA